MTCSVFSFHKNLCAVFPSLSVNTLLGDFVIRLYFHLQGNGCITSNVFSLVLQTQTVRIHRGSQLSRIHWQNSHPLRKLIRKFVNKGKTVLRKKRQKSQVLLIHSGAGRALCSSVSKLPGRMCWVLSLETDISLELLIFWLWSWNGAVRCCCWQLKTNCWCPDVNSHLRFTPFVRYSICFIWYFLNITDTKKKEGDVVNFVLTKKMVCGYQKVGGHNLSFFFVLAFFLIMPCTFKNIMWI